MLGCAQWKASQACCAKWKASKVANEIKLDCANWKASHELKAGSFCTESFCIEKLTTATAMTRVDLTELNLTYMTDRCSILLRVCLTCVANPGSAARC